jgi:hypothetical protein
MLKTLAAALVVAVIAPITLTVAMASDSSADTNCWDQYNVRGTRSYGTIVPTSITKAQCTTGSSCFWGYDTTGKKNRLFVPYKWSPQKCLTTTSPTTTTAAPTTTKAPVTTSATTLPPTGSGRFTLAPVGAALPSDQQCASRVRPAAETRPENAAANATRGTRANTTYPRVTGAFTGTTDEIIQWTACKWGIDEDWVRAQIVNESYWRQSALGDFTSSANACAPGFPIGNYPAQYNGDSEHRNQCPESIGLGQVRWLYHQSAFVDGNAVASSAYNLDYTYAVWRECYEGRFGWLNDVERGATYAAGDAKGCLGVWFSGRWYTQAAVDYIGRFDQTLAARTWEQPGFSTAGSTPTTTVTTAAPTSTAAPTTTKPPATTVAPTTTKAPTTTVAPTTTTTITTTTTTLAPPPATGGTSAFVADFTGNTGLDAFETGVFHRDDFLVAKTSWSADHDMNCGDPSTQRTVQRSQPSQSFYLCRDHLMTSVGDTSGYSIAWFAPKQTFQGGTHTTVSFDVNVTDLGNRQWWEVSIVPVGSPYLATVDWLADVAGIDSYDNQSVVVGKGPFGNDGNIVTKGVQRDPLGWGHICDADREACASKAIRRTFTVTDNRNGTITFDFLGQQYTYAGSFPSQFKVYFKDHNYTPDKDGVPVGHTWHWDNIVVR